MVQENRTIDFDALATFAAVLREGGITAAAAKLGLSKSTVSLQITRLEQRLGTRLLLRSARRLALTREGERLWPRIQSLLSEVALLHDESARATAAPRGTVRMAMTPALGGAVLAALYPALRAEYPEITLIAAPSYEIDDLQDPGFDFALRIGPVRDESLVAQPLGAFRRLLVCAPGHPALALTAKESLADMPLLAFSARSAAVDWFFEAKDGTGENWRLSAAAPLALRDFAVLHQLVRAGAGLAMLPDFLVRADLAAGRLCQLFPAWHSPPAPVHLVHRPGASRLARVAAVMALARQAVHQVLRGAAVA